MNNPFSHLGAIVAIPAYRKYKREQAEQSLKQLKENYVNNCRAYDIGLAIANADDETTQALENAFHGSKATEFYELVLNQLYSEAEQIYDGQTAIAD